MPVLPPKLQLWLTQFNHILAQSERDGIQPTPELARMGLANITEQCVTDIPPINHVIDAEICHTTIPCRIYHPDSNTPLPVILFIHGGGHMCGNIDVYDPISKKLAANCRCIVVSIDYRLAPEHPYPAGIQDASNSLDNLYQTLDKLGVCHKKNITLVGDSAGAALATTIIQTRSPRQPKIDKLVLIYPSLDYTFSADSLIDNGKGYLLETKKIEWYFNQYLQHQEDRAQVSPLFGTIPETHPETLIITAGYCPIKDDGIRYQQRLESEHISCLHLHMENMLHAYLNLEDLAKHECHHTYIAISQFINNPPPL
ncbi:alpha/beta hydrolase [Photobacterium sp. SDRW27]|uniref:alpha/beta hydrolase n=1 Tax=Photobacterium obscurum TaxID=2829490 RepID=UPI0022438D22|nr:alpha/beta hydrolase [Photobacterium obscurum]MCW8328652.1 alpha/beta hydrolase [Photobacterium obscurum]